MQLKMSLSMWNISSRGSAVKCSTELHQRSQDGRSVFAILDPLHGFVQTFSKQIWNYPWYFLLSEGSPATFQSVDVLPAEPAKRERARERASERESKRQRQRQEGGKQYKTKWIQCSDLVLTPAVNLTKLLTGLFVCLHCMQPTHDISHDNTEETFMSLK